MLRAAAILLVACSLGAAAETATPEVAVERGLAALATLQQPDGSYAEGNAVTALAGIAFLAGGHTPMRGFHHDASERCLRALLARQDRLTGSLWDDAGQMYAHGLATLYLAEAYGMAPALPTRRALEGALDLIVSAQNADGGWRYDPWPSPVSDVSVTVCEVMALRAAYDAGVGGAPTMAAMERALAYVRGCSRADGSFAYRADSAAASTGAEAVPRTAAGCMCLMAMGVDEARDRQLGPGLAYLRRHVGEHLGAATGYFWYGQYYAAQVLHRSPDPADWAAYWTVAAPALVARQRPDGSWAEIEGPGPAYATAMALIILQIPDGYLPILQR